MSSPYDTQGNPGHPGVSGKPFKEKDRKLPEEQQDVVQPGVRQEPSTEKVPMNENENENENLFDDDNDD